MSRKVTHCFLHCTAGSQKQTIKGLKDWWRVGMKWKQVGYHWVIEADGTMTRLADDEEITNGVAGWNSHSVHISYFGGIDLKTGKPVDNRTEAQKAAQIELIKEYKKKYPGVKVLGHRDVSPDRNGDGKIEKWEWVKSCPSFDVASWLKEVGLS